MAVLTTVKPPHAPRPAPDANAVVACGTCGAALEILETQEGDHRGYAWCRECGSLRIGTKATEHTLVPVLVRCCREYKRDMPKWEDFGIDERIYRLK